MRIAGGASAKEKVLTWSESLSEAGEPDKEKESAMSGMFSGKV